MKKHYQTAAMLLVSGALFAGAGCGDGASSADAGVDAGGDGPGGLNDMASPPRPAGGPFLFTELTGKALNDPNGPDITFLSPALSFRTPGQTIRPSDYNDVNPAIGTGCTGNHYDTTTGDVPNVTANGGTVTITGYTGGMLSDGTTASNSIVCSFMNNAYDCTYGVGGPRVVQRVFAAGVDPLRNTDGIVFSGAGSSDFGTFTTMPQAPARRVTATEGAANLTYTAGMDRKIGINCPDDMGGVCNGVVAVSVDVSRNPPTMEGPSQTFGNATCIFLVGGNDVTIPAKAIDAMLGCSGGQCDKELKSVRTIIVRYSFPPGASVDSMGNPIRSIVTGHGVIGRHAIP